MSLELYFKEGIYLEGIGFDQVFSPQGYFYLKKHANVDVYLGYFIQDDVFTGLVSWLVFPEIDHILTGAYGQDYKRIHFLPYTFNFEKFMSVDSEYVSRIINTKLKNRGQILDLIQLINHHIINYIEPHWGYFNSIEVVYNEVILKVEPKRWHFYFPGNEIPFLKLAIMSKCKDPFAEQYYLSLKRGYEAEGLEAELTWKNIPS